MNFIDANWSSYSIPIKHGPAGYMLLNRARSN